MSTCSYSPHPFHLFDRLVSQFKTLVLTSSPAFFITDHLVCFSKLQLVSMLSTYPSLFIHLYGLTNQALSLSSVTPLIKRFTPTLFNIIQIVVMLKLIAKKRLIINQISWCQQVFYYTNDSTLDNTILVLIKCVVALSKVAKESTIAIWFVILMNIFSLIFMINFAILILI
jgi:hypothetical protein